MGRIEVVAKEAKECQVKLKEELKVEMQGGEARVLTQVESVRAAIKHLSSSTLIFPLGTFDLDPEPIEPVLDPIVVAHPPDEATDLP